MAAPSGTRWLGFDNFNQLHRIQQFIAAMKATFMWLRVGDDVHPLTPTGRQPVGREVASDGNNVATDVLRRIGSGCAPVLLPMRIGRREIQLVCCYDDVVS